MSQLNIERFFQTYIIATCVFLQTYSYHKHTNSWLQVVSVKRGYTENEQYNHSLTEMITYGM
jgi:hypothetical protein